MLHGALIAESLRSETILDDLNIVVRKLVRSQPTDVTPDQARVWTILYFEAEDAAAGDLSSALADALDTPGWYADFSSERETFVIYPGRIFRYARGDQVGRTEAVAHGRSLGVPEPQLDLPT